MRKLPVILLVAAFVAISIVLPQPKNNETEDALSRLQAVAEAQDARIAQLENRVLALEEAIESLRASDSSSSSSSTEYRPSGSTAHIMKGAVIISRTYKEISSADAFALAKLIYEEADSAHVEYPLMLAIFASESRFKTTLVSPAGATGLGQLMPRTARSLAKKAGMAYNDEMLYDPRANARLSSRYVASLFKKFTTHEIVAAAYNGGPGGAYRYSAWKQGKRPEADVPKETRNYVARVMERYNQYRAMMI
jgi:soluble lytic murein transglycosylase